MDHPLDNHIWQALAGPQAEYSLSFGDVRLFRPEIAPGGGMKEVTPANLATLAAAIPYGSTIIVSSLEPLPPLPELQLLDAHPLLQMVANRLVPFESEITPKELSPADIPAITRLVDATRPGPLLPGAFVLGSFVGIFAGDELAAMAGDRLRPPGYGELCTVCSHPDFRGRGYARIVVSTMASRIVARGDTPYLMVVPENTPAVRLYESLGFEPRRQFHFNLLKRVA